MVRRPGAGAHRIAQIAARRNVPVSVADATAAFGVLHDGLSEKDGARFTRIVDDYEKSGAEDRCWYARVIFQGIERLGEPSRSKPRAWASARTSTNRRM